MLLKIICERLLLLLKNDREDKLLKFALHTIQLFLASNVVLNSVF